MKIEEAIEILKQNKEIMEMISPPDKQTESLMLAIQALEKQVAKKPVNKPNYECDQCSSFIGYCHEYCHECGQKLDWSEE